jgi:arylsulfatase A
MVTWALALQQLLPNLILIFVDDMGVGDLSCYGQKSYRTPNIDRMASEGVRFTDFYVASPACTPSRAALLTGCYPMRVGLPQVINPDSQIGLNPDETTIAEIAKSKGYTTAMFGKWHLGVNNLMPRSHGFDEFYGIPYSHDMWPPNPSSKWPPLFVYENETVIRELKTIEDQRKLTHQFTQKSIDFISKNQSQPFLIYLPLNQPHVPLAPSKEFVGRSKKGLYADQVLEIDHSVGRILSHLKNLRIDKRTMVMFSSDNGPWLPYGNHAGSSGIYREGKGTTFEGGFRVPGIFWMPGTLPPRTVQTEMASTMDLLPTFCSLANASPPKNTIDGHDIQSLLRNEKGARTPWKWMYYYWPSQLQAVRSGDWKLHVPHNHRHQNFPAGQNGNPAGETTEMQELALYNLKDDPSEKNNLIKQFPTVAGRLQRMIEIGRRELGDSLTKTVGSQVRPPGRVSSKDEK